MIVLHYVGDGERDHAMLPPLVQTATARAHTARFVAWHDIRLHGGGGYKKKLLYALVRAERDSAGGLVAVVDRDRSKSRRVRELEQVREEERAKGRTLPIAVGEADPHGEAWLIDDLEPLRQLLSLPPDGKAPPGRDPKAELDALIDQMGRPGERLAILAELAALVRPERYRRSSKTGLAAFLDDVRRELGVMD